MTEYLRMLTMLPEHMRGGMQRYIEFGIAPGHFLEAVLSNDLMGALSRGDEENLRALRHYGTYLYNYAPRHCYGSRDKFNAWTGIKELSDDEGL